MVTSRVVFYPTDIFHRNNGLKGPQYIAQGFCFRRGNPLWVARVTVAHLLIARYHFGRPQGSPLR